MGDEETAGLEREIGLLDGDPPRGHVPLVAHLSPIDLGARGVEALGKTRGAQHLRRCLVNALFDRAERGAHRVEHRARATSAHAPHAR